LRFQDASRLLLMEFHSFKCQYHKHSKFLYIAPIAGFVPMAQVSELTLSGLRQISFQVFCDRRARSYRLAGHIYHENVKGNKMGTKRRNKYVSLVS
jgi:hypothetical protein